MTLPVAGSAGPAAPHLPHAGLGSRISASIITVFGWAIFLLLYFGFWANGFSAVQSAIVVAASVLFFLMIMGASWASWGLRRYGPARTP